VADHIRIINVLDRLSFIASVNWQQWLAFSGSCDSEDRHTLHSGVCGGLGADTFAASLLGGLVSR
jgi:hypothetical protein